MKSNNTSMKIKVRRARCKQLLAILCHRLETVELIREEIHPPSGDFAEAPLDVAVVRWYGLEVAVPLDCVVFLDHQPYAESAKKWGDVLGKGAAGFNPCYPIVGGRWTARRRPMEWRVRRVRLARLLL